MARILVFCTDLPYFPGKNGHDFFNIRHLARNHEVTVVSPLYDSALAEGVENLEKAVKHLLVWPRHVDQVPLFVNTDHANMAPLIPASVPKGIRSWIFRRLLGIHREPDDAHSILSVFSNCAPYLLKALNQRTWHAIVLIQSNTVPCLDYLPGPGARVIYFHDVRSDYLARKRAVSADSVAPGEVRSVRRQEARACGLVDAVGFVSELDEDRARRMFNPGIATGVAPIPVDTGYFTPAPTDWEKPSHPTILFTGHLSHPPNIDAIRYFAAEIWPLILTASPQARLVTAGMLPAESVKSLVETVPNFELHANVPDIRPYFWNASAYVVPMRFGGGVRQKLFEAWSMEVPVVCTNMAAEGIAVRDGINCWLADTPEHFAKRVIEVLESAERRSVTLQAKAQVETTQSIPVAAGRFEEIIERAISIKRSKPFRLLYDLRWMEIGKAGGSEQMTHELLATLSHLDRTNQYRVFCPRSTYHEWQFPRGFQIRPFYSDPEERAFEGVRAGAVRHLANGLGVHPVLTLPMRTLGKLRRMDFDLVHSMVGYIHPDLDGFPHVLTALDLQHIHYPGFFPKSEWQERDRLYRDAATQAQHIICISEFTRQDMHRHYGVPLEKMSTVWIIPSRQTWRTLAASLREKLLSRLGIQSPFLFFPGHCWPHKNHAKLVEAFALILPHIPKEMNLVFSGRPFPPDHPALGLIRELGLGKRILHLGYRSPLEIQALFQSCFLLVFPSLFEGFGLPVAEAIIAGKPVACSNHTCLPEIAGEAALTFDPTNIHDMGGRLLEIINDPQRYAALVEASRQRRPLFSARLSAIKTLSVYQNVYRSIYN